MATRGVFQLQKLTLFYCEHGGSSKTMRDFLSSGKLIQWAKERPHLQINVQVSNGKHPVIRGEYLQKVSPSSSSLSSGATAATATRTNNNMNLPAFEEIKIQHQICVKSSGTVASTETGPGVAIRKSKSSGKKQPDIIKVLDQLYNRSGRKQKKLTKPVYTQTPSVQGVWTPALNLHLTPEFPMTTVLK